MASNEQNMLMFGDFGDLSQEDYNHIYHILHGQKTQTSSKVEFPWSGSPEQETGAVGGDVYGCTSWGDTVQGVDYGQQVPSDFQGHVGYQGQGHHGYADNQGHSDNYMANMQQPYSNVQFGFDHNTGGHISEQQNYNYNQAGDPDGNLDAIAQSKLKASLKPAERRNKKRRPADYYNKPEGDSQETHMPYNEEYNMHNYEPNHHKMLTQPGNYRSEMHSQMNQQPGNFSDRDYSGASVNDSRVNATHSAPHSNFTQKRYQPYEHHTSNTTNYSTLPTSNTNRADIEQGRNDSLYEVIVEPSTNSNNLPMRTDSYQIQNHDRTSMPNVGASVNSDYFSAGIQQSAHNITNSNVFPNSVSMKAEIQNFPDTSSNNMVPPQTRVNVSVKDAPVVDYSSQNTSHNLSHTSIYKGDNTAHQGQHYDRQIINKAEKEFGNVDTMATDNVMNEPKIVSSVQCEELKDNVDVIEPGRNVVSMATDHGVNAEPRPDADQVSVSETIPEETSKPVAKPSSWAGLFKSSQPAQSSYVSSMRIDNSGSTEPDKRQEKEYSPLPVPATEDSQAKQLGELLSGMFISHHSTSLQPRGLINRGNWCYINGTLQALVACPPFYNLLKKLPRYPALSRGPSSTPILDVLVEFVHEFQPMSRINERGPRGKNMRDITPGQPFEPTYVYKMLQTIAVNPHFKLGKQEDAEEFLSCILDGMHEEMSAVVKLTDGGSASDVESESYTNGFLPADTTDVDEEEDIPQTDDDWEQVGPKKKSVQTRRANFAKTPIADIFAGMIRSAVYKASAKETATLEPFFTLQLDIQSEKVWSVKDALEGLVSKEPVSGYTCSKTNTEVEVTKKLSLEELPPVLILHLKFFVYNKDGGCQKLTKKVDFPVELEITKDLLSPNARNKLNLQQRSYKLFAVVYHHGKTSTGGHYTTSVFHPAVNGWVNSDDSSVKTVMVGQVLKHLAPRVPYLLYYRRLDSH